MKTSVRFVVLNRAMVLFALLIGGLLVQRCEFEPEGLLLVQTDNISVDGNNCTASGTIIHLAKSDVSEHGFFWSTQKSPSEQNGTKESIGSKEKAGSFSTIISNLEYSTTYYVRAFATDNEGTVYGDDLEFTTSPLSVVPPTVITSPVTNITPASATGGGNATDNGGGSITAKGVCWSTSTNPSLSDYHSNDGSGLGIFSSTIAPLSAGTTYYVRAYATNQEGTSYGNEVSFSTPEPPTVNTIKVKNVTNASAQVEGEVSSDGGATVTARGVCWSTIPYPTTSDNLTNEGAGTGSFTSSISGLTANTTYYARTYATNIAGTEYGAEVSFKTFAATVTDYSGNVYYGIQIGDQIWMTKNLAAGHYANGQTIPFVETTADWNANTVTKRAYCWYENVTANKDTYGCLYSWAGAMNGEATSDSNPSGVQGVCPDGWHLPSDSEWKQLELHLGMSQAEADSQGGRGTVEGGKLKEAGFDHWASPNTGANNESGFTALPGGFRGYTGGYAGLGSSAFFWTATDVLSDASWSRNLDADDSDVDRNYNMNKSGMSVRCVQD